MTLLRAAFVLLWLTAPIGLLAATDPFVAIDQTLAERRIPEALAQIEPLAASKDPRTRALAQSRLTLAALKAGQGATRKTEIESAVKILRGLPNERLELARALLWASEVAAAEDDNATRLRLGEESIALFEQQAGAERELMEALLRVSNADGRLDRAVEGAAKVARAAALADQIGASPIERARILGRQGAFAYGRADLDAAEHYYRQMYALTREHAPKSLEHANAIANTALVAADRGQLASAHAGYVKAIALRSELGGRSQMIAGDLTTLAEIEIRLGQRDPARSHLLDARERLLALDGRSEIYVMLLLKLAQLEFDRGESTQALAWFEEAQSVAEQLPFECACKAKTLMSLGWFNLRAAHPQQALAQYQHAVALYRASPTENLNLSYARAGEAEALLALGRLDDANAALAEAIPWIAGEAPDSIDHAHLVWVQGRALRAAGDIAGAREHYCRASHMLDRASLQGGDDVGQARFRREYAEIYRDCIEAAAADGDAAAVFDGLERLRLRRAGGDEALPESAVLTLAQLRARLPANAVFLSYLIGTGHSQLLAVTRERDPQVLTLDASTATLTDQVGQLRARILARADVGDRELRDQAQGLQRMLLAPAQDSLRGKKRLIVAPDGPLHDLPWAALYDGKRWLIERSAIIVVDTLSDSGKPHPAGGEVLGVADAGDAALPAALARDADQRLPPLPHAREEVAGLDRLGASSTELLLGDAATESGVRARLPGARWAHFAVHAWLNPERPLESALLLHPDASAQGAASDGLLQAFEIARLPLVADVVVLSGCDTGRGGTLEGVGLVGLVRAFRAAGAAQVIASLWSIEDRGTAELFSRYYRHPSADVAAGWRNSSRSALSHPGYQPDDARERGVGGLAPATKSAQLLPYHWAALQVYGRPW